MSAPRREDIPERFARHLRSERERAVRSSGGGTPVIRAPIIYEQWQEGHVSDVRPEPGETHHARLGEPVVNTTGDPNVWDEDDPFWLRVPMEGLWRASIRARISLTLNLTGGTGGGYGALEFVTYDNAIATYPKSSHRPEGRFPDLSGIEDELDWVSLGGNDCRDLRWLPEGLHAESGTIAGATLGYTFAGIPSELPDTASVRVMFAAGNLEPFSGSSEWRSLSFSGDIVLERVVPMPVEIPEPVEET